MFYVGNVCFSFEPINHCLAKLVYRELAQSAPGSLWWPTIIPPPLFWQAYVEVQITRGGYIQLQPTLLQSSPHQMSVKTLLLSFLKLLEMLHLKRVVETSPFFCSNNSSKSLSFIVPFVNCFKHINRYFKDVTCYVSYTAFIY